MLHAHEFGPAIEITNVTLQRGKQPNLRKVLNGFNLQVGQGEIYAMLGGNGAGKSTTLSLLLGFLKPDVGSVRLAGVDPATDADQARQRCAYLPENVALYDQLSAYENIVYFMALAGVQPRQEEIDSALDSAGLQSEARHRRIGSYSKGMRQKVAIAMAVLRDVPVLLLDEPSSGLDPQATADFTRLLGVLKARGTAILMVTHDLLGATDCADRIGFLAAGSIAKEVRPCDGIDVMALYHQYQESAAA